MRSHFGRDCRSVFPRRGEGGHRSLSDPGRLRDVWRQPIGSIIAGEVRGPKLASDHIEATARQAIKDIGYEQKGFQLARREDRDPAACAVGRHCAGRGRHGQQGRGRGRSGHHVRLCLPGNARTDAGAAVLRPQDPARDIAGATFGRGENARSRRQEPGHGPLPEREARRGDPDRRLAPASHRGIDLRRGRRAGASLCDRRAPSKAGSPRRRFGTSTPPASFSSAVPTAIPASRAARSSSTPMAGRRRTAAAPSPARIRPRSTVRRPMRLDTSPRTSSPPTSPTAARSSFPMRSASRVRCRFTPTSTAPGRSTKASSRRR